MRTGPRVVLVLVLSAGACGLAGSALAVGLPLPLPTLVPLPTPTVAPLPPAPLPTVPSVPGLRLPGLPTGPAAPGTKQQNAAGRVMSAADFGYLPWGHYVDDGLGSGVGAAPAIPTPSFALPPDTGYDQTGYDQTDYALRPQVAAARADRHQSAAAAIGQVLEQHVLLDVLAVLTLAGAAAGVTVARRRGLV